jgi:uncharacterized protein YutD
MHILPQLVVYKDSYDAIAILEVPENNKEDRHSTIDAIKEYVTSSCKYTLAYVISKELAHRPARWNYKPTRQDDARKTE